MTSINKLTKNSIVNPGDLLVIWDEENQRTRSISYDTLKAAVPYLESAEYIGPNLILTQSDGETITVAIPSGGDVISGLLDGQVPVKDQATGQLVYSGATVNSETGQWVFDRTIEVPSSSLDVGDVVTISEGSTDLLISNNIDGIVSAVVSSEIDSTGAKPPSYFKFGEEKSFIPQPFDDEVITTNPLIASSTGRVVSPDVRQINQTIFRADQDMPNVVAQIKDKASGMVIKYIPSRAAWEAETEEDRARNPGLDFIAGDNVIDYVSREADSDGVFNIGVSPFRLTEGQEFEIIIKADVMALKGISGVPYLAEMVQDGPEVSLASSGGFIDYNDTSTLTAPLTLLADTWTTIPNDGLGSFTNKDFAPEGVSELMDSQGRIDPTGLSLGDDLIIRNDFSVSPNVNNALLRFRYELGDGGDTYQLETNLGRLDYGSGKYYKFSLSTDYIYMGDTNTLDNPIKLQVNLSTDGTLINTGSVIKVSKGL